MLKLLKMNFMFSAEAGNVNFQRLNNAYKRILENLDMNVHHNFSKNRRKR